MTHTQEYTCPDCLGARVVSPAPDEAWTCETCKGKGVVQAEPIKPGAFKERLLIAVLRAGAAGRRRLTPHACQSALDKISAQQAEIEILNMRQDTRNEERLSVMNLNAKQAQMISVLNGTNKHLQTEIERLRVALQSIAQNTCCDRCQEVALAALNEQENRHE